MLLYKTFRHALERIGGKKGFTTALEGGRSTWPKKNSENPAQVGKVMRFESLFVRVQGGCVALREKQYILTRDLSMFTPHYAFFHLSLFTKWCTSLLLFYTLPRHIK